MAEKNTATEEDLGIYNALLSGSAFNSTTFGAAITAATGAAAKILLLPTGTWTLTSNHTVPRGLTLRVPAGTLVTSAAPVTITLQGPLVADDPMWYGGQVTVTYSYPQAAAPAGCILSGGQPAVPGSGLVIGAFATSGMVRDGASLWPVFQAAATVTITNNATVWLALHRHTTQTVTNWSREGSTHYLFRAIADQPADPAGGLVFAKVTVAGGNITAISSCAYRSPDGSNRRVQNVRHWGALGDAATNDTAAFTAAIAALPNGGIIEIPCGIYMVDALTIDQFRGITLQGSCGHMAGFESGQGSDSPTGRSVLRARGSQAHVLRLEGYFHQVHDLVLDGNFTTTDVVTMPSAPTSMILLNRCVVQGAVPTTGDLVTLNGGASQVDMIVIRECMLSQNPGDPTVDRCKALIDVQGSNTFLNRVENSLLVGATIGVDINQGGIDVIGCNFQNIVTACIRGVVPQTSTISRCYCETATTWFYQDVTCAAVNVAAPIVLDNNQLNAAMSMTFTQRHQVYLVNNRIGNGNVALTGAGQCSVYASGNAFATTSTGFTGAGVDSPGLDEFGNVYIDGSGNFFPFTHTRTTQRHAGLIQIGTGATNLSSAGDLYLGADSAIRWAIGGDASQALRMRTQAVTLNNGQAGNLTTDNGFLFVITPSGACALFVLHGAGNDTTELLDPGGVFSGTAGTGASANIYWDVDHYELQNNLGSTVTFRMLYLGDST